MRALLLTLAMILPGASVAVAGGPGADVGAPAADVADAQDHPLLPRDEGSLIVDQAVLDPGRASLPVSTLRPTDRLDDQGNQVSAAADTRDLAGRVTRTVYLSSPGRDPLDTFRGYEAAIRALGGEILHACTSRACGGDVSGGAGHDGGRTGIVDAFAWERRPVPEGSPAACATGAKHRNQRYALARLPRLDGDAHAAVLTYAIQAEDAEAAGRGCGAFADRAVAIVLVIEPEAGQRPPAGAAVAPIEPSPSEERPATVVTSRPVEDAALKRPSRNVDRNPGVAKVAVAARTPDNRCWRVAERAQLGEVLSDEERALLRSRCRL